MDLREAIQSIKIIDQHCHPIDYWYWFESVGSNPFAKFSAKLAVPDQLTTRPREQALLRIYKTLYGFPYDKITPDNEAQLQEAFQRSKPDEITEAQLFYRMMDLAGIESAVNICSGRPVLPPGLDNKRFGRVVAIDGFAVPLDNSTAGSNERQRQFIKMVEYFPNLIREQAKPRTFDDYLQMISSTFEEVQRGGTLGFKMNHAYWREMNIDVVNKKEAEDVFAKQDNSPARYKKLQDYIIRFMLAKAAELEMPVHIHTGCAASLPQPMFNGDPALLDPILWQPDLLNTKVILLHGGYPYTREAGFMAFRGGDVPKLFLDISVIPWWHYGSPHSLVPILKEWLGMGLAPKMLYGSDSLDPVTMWMGAINAREALYLALKDLVDSGMIDQDQAVMMAQMILHDNARNLYKDAI
jgi:predicted TIM-barrel fold metal-dependent hydrolase